MSSIAQEKSASTIKAKLATLFSGERTLELLGITVIVIIAVTLRFANLDSLGYANHYYTAGVKSMLQSWHNFFYVAAEPGGSVTIDKPPVGLWLQVISAYFLGVNGFSVLLPQLLAGVLSVIVLYHLVRRSFGVVPGLIAALALAITPIVVATDRNNTIDSPLILTLLVAAWAFIKATETNRIRYLFLGAALVGIGFNIKMLQAYLPLPAFYALYFLGSSETFWRKTGKLILMSVLLLAVSLSWAVAVDLTPSDQRPYVGSSSENSETDLILGYNGVNRLLGMFGRRGGPGGFARPPAQGQGTQPGVPFQADPNSGNGSPFPRNRNNFPYPPGGFIGPNGNRPQFGGGFMGTGSSGPLRLFLPPLSKEVSWLLPFGLVSAILLAMRSRWKWPLSPRHQALVLWGGWLLTCAVFFSIAGFFHEYYLSMMGPPLAALVAIGVHQLWDLKGEHPWHAITILAASVAVTLWFQHYTASSFVQNVWWLPLTMVLFILGLLLLAVTADNWRQSLRFALGFTLLVAAIFITPGIWSALTNWSASQNQSLPSAYSGGAIGPVAQRGLQINQNLLDYLEANTENMKYLMAVPSAMQGADYIIATGRPVLYMGGFMGQDDVVSAEDLARMVKDGELRYIYWNAGGRGMGENSDISSWVTSACTPVQGFDTSTRNSGAPDGIGAAPNNTTTDSNNPGFPGSGPMGAMQVTLYDCAD